MKVFLILIVSLFFAIAAIGQDLPDSGFTNKAEAKNLMVNGIKEGKWVEYFGWEDLPVADISKAYMYKLAIYKAGKYTGIVRGYTMKGVLLNEAHYIDDQRDGITKEYDGVSGGVWIEIPYTKGKINGVYEKYFSSGKIEYESPFINGKKNGIVKDYYKDGAIKTETSFIDDTTNGLMKTYYENGKLKDSIRFTNGKKNGVEKWYYKSGKLWQETTFKDDKIAVATKTYCENGKDINKP